MIDDVQLADQLLDLELLNEERLQQGRQHQNLTGSTLYDVLIQKDILPESLLVDVAADILNIPSVHLTSYEFVPEIVGLISSTMAHRTRALPLAENGGLLLLAMADPLDIMAMDEIASHTSIDIQPVLVGPNDLQRAIERAYANQALELSKPGQPHDPTIDLMQMSSDSSALGNQDSWGAFFDEANLSGAVESEQKSQEMRDRPSSLEFELEDDEDEHSEPIIDLGGWEVDGNQEENYIDGEPSPSTNASGDPDYANLGEHYMEGAEEESEAIALVDEVAQNDSDFFESIFNELADPEDSFEEPSKAEPEFQLEQPAIEPPPGTSKSLDALRSLRAKLNKSKSPTPSVEEEQPKAPEPPPIPADSSPSQLGRLAVKRIAVTKSTPPPIVERNSHLERKKHSDPPEEIFGDEDDVNLTVEAPEYILHELAGSSVPATSTPDTSETPEEDAAIIYDNSLAEKSPAVDGEPFILENYLSQDSAPVEEADSDLFEEGEPPPSFMREHLDEEDSDGLDNLFDSPPSDLSEDTATVDEKMQQHVEEIRGMMRASNADETVDRELYNRVTTMNQALTMDRLRDMRREQVTRPKQPLPSSEGGTEGLLETYEGLRAHLPQEVSDKRLLHAALTVLVSRDIISRDDLIALAQSLPED